MKDILIKEVEKIKENLIKINDTMYYNPELGNEEYNSIELLISFLEQHDFVIEKGVANLPTAFRAVYDTGKPGPVIAYLCEYDSLPEIGHGCGHNMIGTMSAGAGAALSKIIHNFGGKIIILGTPAEETDGGKVYMVDDGIFNDIDIAMMLHPSEKSYDSGISLALDALEFEFTGKSSHAASEPEKGINALDAVIMTFNGINALRQHVKSDVRIHGIITEGGVAANIVPEKAVCQFYVRSQERGYLNEVVKKVKDIAYGAAKMVGAELSINNYEISYDNMVTNQTLANSFRNNMEYLGVDDLEANRSGFGSIDMGNVSHVVPAIHPYIGLEEGLISHSKGFADFTITEKAHNRLSIGACALALTGYDILNNPSLFEAIKAEYKQRFK
jgi:amidohydrolase